MIVEKERSHLVSIACLMNVMHGYQLLYKAKEIVSLKFKKKTLNKQSSRPLVPNSSISPQSGEYLITLKILETY